jgi:hypothetical protein
MKRCARRKGQVASRDDRYRTILYWTKKNFFTSHRMRTCSPTYIILGFPAVITLEVAFIDIFYYSFTSTFTDGAPPGHPACVRGDDVGAPSMSMRGIRLGASSDRSSVVGASIVRPHIEFAARPPPSLSAVVVDDDGGRRSRRRSLGEGDGGPRGRRRRRGSLSSERRPHRHPRGLPRIPTARRSRVRHQ